MKKLNIIGPIGFISLIGLIFPPPVFAQTLDAYQVELDSYNQAYGSFLSAKTANENYHTIKAEEALAQAAVNVLIARDEVWLSFFAYHFQQLNQTPDTGTNQRLSLQSQIDQEIKIIQSHRDKVAKTKLRTEALKLATQLNQKKESLTKLVNQLYYYETLATYTHTVTSLSAAIDVVSDMVTNQYFEAKTKEVKLRGLSVIKQNLNETILPQLQMLDQSIQTGANITELARVKAEVSNQTATIKTQIEQEYQRFQEVIEGIAW